MIIHINGMPGVGKLTVAQHLAASLGARLIDNHRIIDAATTCTDHGTPEYLDALDQITAVIFNKLEKLPQKDIFIFTNALAAELPEDIERLNKFARFAHLRGVPFVPVVLTCSAEQNRLRMMQPSRAAKGKLMDIKILDRLMDYTILHLHDHANAIILDTTDLSPEQASTVIEKHVTSIKE
ncbi:MAG: hypothetical protein EYC62_07910 [Alphaproteobacteria bacterium]|nr:MAG: hypothetical protein EYC62_07910 [Alphaproteobacteria bacterium]